MYTLWFEVGSEIISVVCPSIDAARVVYDAMIASARALCARS